MCAKLNIEVATTAGESPFNNGKAERHDNILAEAMQKTLDHVKCELDIALAWAVSAKNELQNCGGYGPNQLVPGRNVNMPTALEDKLPALESNTSNDIIHETSRPYIVPVKTSSRLSPVKELDKHQDIMYVHMLMKVSIMVIQYITSRGKEGVGVL